MSKFTSACNWIFQIYKLETSFLSVFIIIAVVLTLSVYAKAFELFLDCFFLWKSKKPWTLMNDDERNHMQFLKDFYNTIFALRAISSQRADLFLELITIFSQLFLLHKIYSKIIVALLLWFIVTIEIGFFILIFHI